MHDVILYCIMTTKMPKRMIPRILEPPSGSFFLFGPRGTGKSTWLREMFPQAHTIDLLSERRYQAYLADPGLFGDELRAVSRGGLVVVDEVQRLPGLLNEVHAAMETRAQRFILCGSSARKLKKQGTNLLAGRAVRRFMHPFVPEELGEAFRLEECLRWGCLPVVWDAAERSESLEAYVQMYLKEDVRAEALVRNLPGFARFLGIAALYHGQLLNVSGLARDAGVSRTTVNGYLEILEDTLVAFRLPGFESRLRVRERKHPKLYWVDPGIPRALKKQLGPPAHEERGALMEGWIASVLRAYRDYRRLFDEWWHWSFSPSGEVDFLLRKGDRYVALEVKSSGRYSRSFVRNLRRLPDLPGLLRRIVVYPGEHHARTEDGIEVLPLEAFLSAIRSGDLF